MKTWLAARPSYIFGAGQNGRLLLQALRASGHEPTAFIDETPGRAGQTVDGLQVVGIAQATEHGRCLAASSVFNPISQFVDLKLRLNTQDIDLVHIFQVLRTIKKSLPFYFIDSGDEIRAAREELLWLAGLLNDPQSLAELISHVAFRLTLDFAHLPAVSWSRPGLPAGWKDATVVDCGAFDGDTLLPLLSAEGAKIAEAIALEPDPANFNRLKENLAPLAGSPPHIRCLQAGVSDRTGVRGFTSLGNTGSSFSDMGVETPVVALDDILHALRADGPLYIKMDIEGAEAEGLRGAAGILARNAPTLAVAVYHGPTDLWEIPRLIHQLNPAYRFRLRSHGADGADLMIYAATEDVAWPLSEQLDHEP